MSRTLATRFGHAFLDQDFAAVRHVVDTNTTGTIYLEKDDPVDVAKVGFEAMLSGDADVVAGFTNKVQTTIAKRRAERGARRAPQAGGTSEEVRIENLEVNLRTRSSELHFSVLTSQFNVMGP